MKPTKELTPSASAELDNYIRLNFEDINEMTDEEQTALELQNAGLTSEFDLTDRQLYAGLGVTESLLSG